MKNKFVQISIGITMMLFGLAFLVRSANTANATPPSPKEFIEEGTSKIGKYQLSLVSSGDATAKSAIILNTETGETVYYYFNDDGGSEWSKSKHQLPASPFAN